MLHLTFFFEKETKKKLSGYDHFLIMEDSYDRKIQGKEKHSIFL